jgi:hypothetical protein
MNVFPTPPLPLAIEVMTGFVDSITAVSPFSLKTLQQAAGDLRP